LEVFFRRETLGGANRKLRIYSPRAPSFQKK
jgi:hypothetical protein